MSQPLPEKKHLWNYFIQLLFLSGDGFPKEKMRISWEFQNCQNFGEDVRRKQLRVKVAHSYIWKERKKACNNLKRPINITTNANLKRLQLLSGKKPTLFEFFKICSCSWDIFIWSYIWQILQIYESTLIDLSRKYFKIFKKKSAINLDEPMSWNILI